MTVKLPFPQPRHFPPLRNEHLKIISTDHVLGRVYNSGGPYPTRWNTFRTVGPTGSRFDQHPPPCRDHVCLGILYGASQSTDPNHEILVTCLLERFQQNRVVNRDRHVPHFVTHRPTRPLRLLDLTSEWIAAARGNAAISSGTRAMARRWSRAIYAHYDDIDGLWYQCSLLGSRHSLALYERAADAWPAHPIVDVPLADSSLDNVMENELPRVGYSLVNPNARRLFDPRAA